MAEDKEGLKDSKKTSFGRLAEATHKEMSPEATEKLTGGLRIPQDMQEIESIDRLEEEIPATSAEDGTDADEEEQNDTPKSDIPDWVIIPEGMKFPNKGKQIYFGRILANLTDTPTEGDRQFIMWGLTPGDERLARIAMRGEDGRYMAEMSKRAIRAIDGVSVDYTRKPGAGNIDLWWRDIGHKGRQIVQNMYNKTHMLQPEDRLLFFAQCVSVYVSK
jgi:hypothetical protein